MTLAEAAAEAEADARLLDGSRVNIIIPPLAIDGPALTIQPVSGDLLRHVDCLHAGRPSIDSRGDGRLD